MEKEKKVLLVGEREEGVISLLVGGEREEGVVSWRKRRGCC